MLLVFFNAAIVVFFSTSSGAAPAQSQLIIPSAAAQSVDDRIVSYRDLLDINDIGVTDQHDYAGVAISHDGKLAAIDSRQAQLNINKTTIRWLLVSLDGSGKVIEAGDGGEPIPVITGGLTNGNSLPERPQWSPDDQWIAYRARHSGETQVWRSRRDGKRQEALTRNSADVESFQWSKDGRKLYYTTGQPRDEFQQVLREERKLGYLYDERFVPSYGITAPVLPRNDIQSEPVVWVFDVSRRIERRADESEIREHLELAANDGRRSGRRSWIRRSFTSSAVAWLEDQRENQSAGIDPALTIVASQRADGTEPYICTESQCTGYFKGLWISEDGGSVFFLRWTGAHTYGPIGLYRWEIGTRKIRQILVMDDLLQGCAQLKQQLICAYESSVSPAKLVSVRLSDGAIETIYDPNPKFKSLRFGEVSSLTWQDRNGAEGFGHLVKPIGYQPGVRYPLIIVQYHSRGFLRGGVGDEYPIHIFAANGFAVLSIERPWDWQMRSKAVDYGDLDKKMWDDFHDRKLVLSVIVAAINRLDEMEIIDPKRVGITGLSDGANTASFGLIHASDRFAAASVSYTAWNPMLFYVGGAAGQSVLSTLGLSYPDSDAAASRWRGISVALNAASIKAPLLIQVSDSELLPETQTFTALQQFRKPVEMHVFPDEYHIKWQPAHRIAIYRRNVQWFKFWLQQTEEVDPLDPNQYARWRNLRNQAGLESVAVDTPDERCCE